MINLAMRIRTTEHVDKALEKKKSPLELEEHEK